jgi:hypothetical protein
VLPVCIRENAEYADEVFELAVAAEVTEKAENALMILEVGDEGCEDACDDDTERDGDTVPSASGTVACSTGAASGGAGAKQAAANAAGEARNAQLICIALFTQQYIEME